MMKPEPASARATPAKFCTTARASPMAPGTFSMTAASMTDASFALGEQFCLARTYAMATGEELAAKVAGFTPQQIAEQCAGFGPVLAPHVSALSLKTRVLLWVSLAIADWGVKLGLALIALVPFRLIVRHLGENYRPA